MREHCNLKIPGSEAAENKFSFSIEYHWLDFHIKLAHFFRVFLLINQCIGKWFVISLSCFKFQLDNKSFIVSSRWATMLNQHFVDQGLLLLSFLLFHEFLWNRKEKISSEIRQPFLLISLEKINDILTSIFCRFHLGGPRGRPAYPKVLFDIM